MNIKCKHRLDDVNMDAKKNNKNKGILLLLYQYMHLILKQRYKVEDLFFVLLNKKCCNYIKNLETLTALLPQLPHNPDGYVSLTICGNRPIFIYHFYPLYSLIYVTNHQKIIPYRLLAPHPQKCVHGSRCPGWKSLF